MRRTVPLAVQLLAMQVVIVVLTVLAAGVLAVRLEDQQIRDTYGRRVLTIARSLAADAAVQEAYESPDPRRQLGPLAEQVRQAAGATFVVFTDATGIRYTHPDPEKVGQPVSTDPSVALGGEEFVGTETGSLGASLRAKVPVRDRSGVIRGALSVGILESRLSADLADVVPVLAAWLAIAALLGVLGAAAVSRLVRRRIFGLEPEQIADLLKTRHAMLHGIRAGVVAVDDGGRLALVNDEALRLLGLTHDPTGRPAADVLEPEVLQALVGAGEQATDRLVLAGERLLVANRTTSRVGQRDVGRVLTLRDRTELFDALRALDGQRSITDALRAQAHEFSNHLHVLAGLINLGRHDEAVSFVERLGPGAGLHGGDGTTRIEDASVAALLVAKAAAARERGVTLRLEPGSAVGDGVGDDVLTILANLVDNAVDAAGAGGTVAVLAVARADEPVVLRVADDGPGVPAADRADIFTVGFSTKVPTPDHHGRGIGLALVSRIVSRRQGTVSVGERPGGGAVFAVTLPAPVPAGVPSPVPSPAGAAP